MFFHACYFFYVVFAKGGRLEIKGEDDMGAP